MNDNQHQSVVIRKELFIASREQDIRKHYRFFPKFLGKGSSCTVYRAKMMTAPYSERAVKVISKAMLRKSQNLINEVSILKRLDHPNIIRLYQTFQDKDNYYLVLDFCEGGQLFTRLSTHGSFSEQDARNIFTQVIKIVKYLHTHKIAHRDLKLENFLMYSQESLEIKIIDFGLSYQFQKDMKAQLHIKDVQKMIGTSYYVAPQVIDLNYDQRCDIWSAGVLLYILATASPPFDGEEDEDILQSVIKQEYSLETPQATRLSDSLKDLIKRMLVPEDKRITVDQILEHPWMTTSLPQHSLELNFKKLQEFSRFSKLKTIAVTYIASRLPQKQIHQLGEIFKQIDENDDGQISLEQLTHALERQKQNHSLQELNKIMETIDTDRNGTINYNEFIASSLETSIMNNEIYLEEVFRSFDKDHNGTISKKEFKEILESSNISNKLLGSYIDEIVEDCDQDHDGEINYREFLESIGFQKSEGPGSPDESSYQITRQCFDR